MTARTEIVLIGPTGVGKTTVAKHLAEKTGLRHFELDKERYRYYDELDYDSEYVSQLRKVRDYQRLIEYWQPFDAHAVERCLGEQRGVIFDFGAIHACFDEPSLSGRIDAALRPFKNVFLLLPSPDAAESVGVLLERGKGQEDQNQDELAMWRRIIERQVASPLSRRIARHMVYTAEATAEQTASAIWDLVAETPRRHI